MPVEGWLALEKRLGGPVLQQEPWETKEQGQESESATLSATDSVMARVLVNVSGQVSPSSANVDAEGLSPESPDVKIHARFGTRVDGNTSAPSPTLTSENGAVLQGELVQVVEAFALRSDPTASAGAGTYPVLASVRQMQILPWPAWQAIHVRFGPLSASLTSETGVLPQGELVPAVEPPRLELSASAGASADQLLRSVHEIQTLPWPAWQAIHARFGPPADASPQSQDPLPTDWWGALLAAAQGMLCCGMQRVR